MNCRVHSLRRKLRQFERNLNLAAKIIKERNISLAKLRHENSRLRQQLLKARKLTESDEKLIDSMNRHIKVLEDLIAFQWENINELKEHLFGLLPSREILDHPAMEQRKVSRNGIHYKGEWYNHIALRAHIDDTVWVFPFEEESLLVVYNSAHYCICGAEKTTFSEKPEK